MKPVRGFPAVWALSLLFLAPQLASAAWDNVFQVTCCHKRPTRAAYYAPAPACCPAPAPSVAYVQRSYYEPVTSYRTSYYYEPVTSYSYSCYVDPCTGCPQQVATPVTSYRMRSQCNAVTNYVARVSYKPVTTYRQSCYMEAVPVNPCCPPGGPAPVVAGPLAPILPGTAPPPLNLPPAPGAGLGEQRSLPPGSGGTGLDTYSIPPITGQSNPRPAAPRAAPAPTFRPERVASLPNGAGVTGQVVRSDFAPRPGAKVVFVNANKQDERQAATADATGRFQVSLASGRWYVYVDDAGNGQMTYHNHYDVRGGEARPVTVVSR
jgi:hypothetical protein